MAITLMSKSVIAKFTTKVVKLFLNFFSITKETMTKRFAVKLTAMTENMMIPSKILPRGTAFVKGLSSVKFVDVEVFCQ